MGGAVVVADDDRDAVSQRGGEAAFCLEQLQGREPAAAGKDLGAALRLALTNRVLNEAADRDAFGHAANRFPGVLLTDVRVGMNEFAELDEFERGHGVDPPIFRPPLGRKTDPTFPCYSAACSLASTATR